MKRLIILLFVFSKAYAQEPTYVPMKSNYLYRGIKMDSLFLPPVYPDTSTGTSKVNFAGSMIRVGSKLYMRNSVLTKWIDLSDAAVATDSTVFFTKYRSDTMRTNIYGQIAFVGNPNLQQVTNNGNTTTNDIQFTNDNDLLMDTFSAVLFSNNSRVQEGYLDAGYGGNHGIALVCGLGYEYKWEGGRLFVMNNSGNAIREAKYMFTDVPDNTHDLTKGYLVGSRWILDNGNTYVCTDNSLNAAVWALQPNAFDSTSLSNRINAKADTSALSLKLNRSDSTLYYTKYRSDTSRSNIYASMALKMAYSDTVSLSNRINDKIDSLRRLGTQVGFKKNGTWYNAYTDSTGGQNGRWGNDTATIVLAKVHNGTGTTLSRGTVVMMNGATGDVASVIRANNKYDSTSARTIGVVKDAISAGDTGWVVTQGQASKLNLGAFTAGDVLYLDSIDGGLTKTKPKAPNHIVFIGIVERANNGNGLLYTKPQNGYELDEIHDVRITSPINNQVLVYSDTQQLWNNRNVYSVVDTTGLSNRINAKPNLNATSTYIPYREGSSFRDSYLVNDTTGKILKSVYGGNDIGLKLDFANNYYQFGTQGITNGIGFIVDNNSSTISTEDYINGTNGFTIQMLPSPVISFGDQANAGNNLLFYIEDPSKRIKTTYGGNDIGLKLDFANSDYNIGTSTKNFQVKNDSLKINGLIGQSGDSVVNITNSGKLGKISIAGKVNVSDTASMLTNYQRTSAFPIATFGAGSGAAGDTTAFTTSAIYGSFYLNAGSDTIIVTGYTGVVQGTSASVTPSIWFNDSLNVTAGGIRIVNSPAAVTSTTTGNTVTSLDNTKIPPGNFVWVTTGTVTTKPTYFNLTLIGYRKR